jgi:tetratricopeptide repeat protein/cytochrome c554/c'-like protein
MNWFTRRRVAVPLRLPGFPLGEVRTVALAAVFLIWAATRIAQAHQTAQAPPSQETPSPRYLNAQPGVDYVGDEACQNCHLSEYQTFKKTGMGRSAAIPSPEDLRELATPVSITRKKLNRSYSVYARDGRVFHEESERDARGQPVFSESHEIAYTIGAGDVGKSYLVAKGDALFVSPISYYSRIRDWDLSPGYSEGTFRGFTRRVVELCVDCHTGLPQLAPGSHNRFQQPPFRFLSVGCERCHGPGALHVAQRKQSAPLNGPVDFSIVNPERLRPEVRDDVCAQCHFSGDARVLQPGKNYLDFRPGTPLGDVVDIFSVAPAIKGTRFIALDQFEQLKMSRCSLSSKGRLGCITCHNPHVQLHGSEAADFFRQRCLSCHATESCRAPMPRRQATSPPDNCILCHMPQRKMENISHSSLTDHRILRTPSETPAILEDGSDAAAPLDLIRDTGSSNPREPQLDLRNLALAYSQVATHYSALGERGLASLEQAAAALPNDVEVQSAYGLVLVVARPNDPQRAAQALQKAIDLGSKSPEVRTQLARLMLQKGEVTASIELYKDSIQAEPYYTPPYLALARVYLLLKDRTSASEILDRLLKLDPGDAAARQERLRVAALPDNNP